VRKPLVLLYIGARKLELGSSLKFLCLRLRAAFVLREHMGNMTFQPPLGPIGDARVLDKNNRPVKTADGYVSISPNTDAQAFAFLKSLVVLNSKTILVFPMSLLEQKIVRTITRFDRVL
jgi:hypothetical protein